MAELRLYGRSTSHFTRVARIVAHEVEVAVDLVHVEDLLGLDPTPYGGHPGLKIPSLHVEGEVVFGAANVARRLARSSLHGDRIVWPQGIDDVLADNAQELIWTAMGIEVQVVLGDLTSSGGVLQDKARVALSSLLAWLDERLDAILATLPTPRATSLLEITLFCLIEHVRLRATVPIAPHARLAAFASRFGARPSSVATAPR